MNRASPVDLRKALDAAKAYADAGILFVPLPTFSKEEHDQAIQLAAWRLEQLEAELTDQQRSN